MTDAKALTHMLLLPISSKPLFEGQTAIEIPRLELQRQSVEIRGQMDQG
jgi:hypothetical protein